MRPAHSIRSCQPFPAVIPVHPASSLRATHPSAMVATAQAPLPHRLACVKHSVSVHPEPGSNSSFNIIFHLVVPWRGLLLSLDFYFLIYHSAFSSSLSIVLPPTFSQSTEYIISKKISVVNSFFWIFLLFLISYFWKLLFCFFRFFFIYFAEFFLLFLKVILLEIFYLLKLRIYLNILEL